MKKRRSDAKPLDQHRDQLDHWLFVENLSYAEVRARLAEQFGLSVSASSLSTWRKRREEERLLERISEKARLANSAAEQFAAENPAMDKAFTRMLQQVAFEVVSSPKADPKEIFFIASQALKLRDQDLKAESQRLAREKFELYKDRLEKVNQAVEKAKRGGGLTPETLAEIEEAARIL